MRNPFQRRKENPTASTTLAYFGGRPQYRAGLSVEALASEAYAGNADVYAAVETKATACAGVPWYAEKIVRGVWQRDDQHPILDLWNRPNPRTGNTAFVGNIVRWRCIAGEAYIARNEKPTGAPRELWLQHPGRMKIVASKNAAREIERYEYEMGGRKHPLLTEDVCHLPFFNPLDEWYGLSPLQAAAKLVDQAAAAADFNLGLLQNGGVPPLFLTMQDSLSDTEFKRFKKELHDVWSASRNAGLPQMLEGGMDVKTVGAPPKDMQMLEAQRFHALKFAQVIRVPAEFLSGAEEKKYGNYGDALKALYTEGALPELDLIQDEVNVWLAPMFGEGVRLRYDRDDVEALREDQNALWSRIDASPELTVDEKRIAKGYEPHPDKALGASLLVPFSLTTMSTITAESAPIVDFGDSKSKALNVPDAQKAAYWKLIDAKRQRTETVVAKMFKAQMDTDARAVVAAIKGATTPPAAIARAGKALDANTEAWRKLQVDVWLKVGEPFAQDVLAQLKTDAGPERVKAADAWIGRITQYLGKHGAKHIKGILDTTKQQVASQIEQGIAAGESIPDLAKRVEAHQLDQIIPNRARTIARTETVSASNAASLEAAKSTELPLEKEWIETADERTRESHTGIEPVALDSAFTLGSGDELEHPGDSSLGASADEIVNCRCAVAFRVIDDAGEKHATPEVTKAADAAPEPAQQPVTVNVTLPEIHNHIEASKQNTRAVAKRSDDGSITVTYEGRK